MRLTIVSGLSGSGKSVALHTLEDEGYYCVDNLPASLLPDLLKQLGDSQPGLHDKVAVGLDARSEFGQQRTLGDTLAKLRASGVEIEILFLQTDVDTLIRRFSETRRKHPLSDRERSLARAIELEKNFLAELLEQADMIIDTTRLTLHELRQQISNIVIGRRYKTLSLLFQSFGFKHGAPGDSDFVFDVRCLPNPHWQPELRAATGRDPEVADFLEQFDAVAAMLASIQTFLDDWIPAFKVENRAYLTVSIGCTGGQHRSVYITEKLCEHFSQTMESVSLRHREAHLHGDRPPVNRR